MKYSGGIDKLREKLLTEALYLSWSNVV